MDFRHPGLGGKRAGSCGSDARKTESHRMPDEFYRDLIESMGGGVKVIANPDEGHWLVFRKL